MNNIENIIWKKSLESNLNKLFTTTMIRLLVLGSKPTDLIAMLLLLVFSKNAKGSCLG